MAHLYEDKHLPTPEHFLGGATLAAGTPRAVFVSLQDLGGGDGADGGVEVCRQRGQAGAQEEEEGHVESGKTQSGAKNQEGRFCSVAHVQTPRAALFATISPWRRLLLDWPSLYRRPALECTHRPVHDGCVRSECIGFFFQAWFTSTKR